MIRATESSLPSDSSADAPVLARVVRGERVESVHRGAWVLVDAAGQVLDGAGDSQRRVFARSSIKSFQALPLIETGAAQRWGVTQQELALTLASHSGEPCHTGGVAGLLARLELGVEALACGPQPPIDARARAALAAGGEAPTALHNNCSGKHAGFLAVARHVGEAPERYLDPSSETQGLVRRAVLELTGSADDELYTAVDGCSAPTFQLPLAKLAHGIARIANPRALAPERRAACERMTAAVAAHPELLAGHRDRLCTDLARHGAGRVFPKVGAEAVYVLGVVGGDRGLAVKIDDGSARGLHAVVVALLERFEWLAPPALAALERWRGRELENWAGRVVGRIEVDL